MGPNEHSEYHSRSLGLDAIRTIRREVAQADIVLLHDTLYPAKSRRFCSRTMRESGLSSRSISPWCATEIRFCTD